jgi:hypothetical protein
MSTNIVSLFEPDGSDRRRRGLIGSQSEAKASEAIFDAVPGRLRIYGNVQFGDETPQATEADLDLLVLTPHGVVAVAVTGSRSGVFERHANRLAVAHAGCDRQVPQLSRSFRTLAASCVGRLAATSGLPMHAVLALDGQIGPRLRSQPWFSIEGRPCIHRGIDVVALTDLGGFIRGRLTGGPCRADAMRVMADQLERAVLTRFEVRHAREARRLS